MPGQANFRVDPRLAKLLGENYRSTEHAIKELVDNAWDADANNVWIQLPATMTDEPIVVQDDGSGMTEREVRHEYLRIANDRRTRKGELTPQKRKVKGRKGIGKFAGLVAAAVMDLRTSARGNETKLTLLKEQILEAKGDLEQINLPISAQECERDLHGTTITLRELSQNLAFPAESTLKQLLALEYGREVGFTMHVNGQPLAHEDIPGDQHLAKCELPNAGRLLLRCTIMERPVKKKLAGIVMRVAGKVVGPPSFMGLEEREDIPDRLLRCIVGEVEADSLEGDVTADWGAFIENSRAYQEARKWACETLNKLADEAFRREISLSKARRQRLINERLAKMPEHRRRFASEALDRVLGRFYGEAEDRIDTVVGLVLDALEKDEYWAVCQKIEAARQADVSTFAEALESFGLVDLAVMGSQARRRMQILDAIDDLAARAGTLEKDIHKALERNLWVFGPEYSVLASNTTLARIVEEYTGAKYRGERAKERPDLLLTANVEGRHLLIEFKKPSDRVGRQAEAQANEYRDELTPRLGTRMGILVVGGQVDPSILPYVQESTVKFLSYDAVISAARNGLAWLLEQLTTRSHTSDQ